MTIESAPRSSKKWLSTVTRSAGTSSASTSTSALCVAVGGGRYSSVPGTAAPRGASGAASVSPTSAPGGGDEGADRCRSPDGRGQTGHQRSAGPGRRDGRGVCTAPAECLVAEEPRHPVGLVDGVQVALPEVWGEGHCGEVLGVVAGQPPHGTADHRAGGAAEEETPAGQPVTGPDRGRFLDPDDLVDVGLVEQRRSQAGAEPGDHPGR